MDPMQIIQNGDSAAMAQLILNTMGGSQENAISFARSVLTSLGGGEEVARKKQRTNEPGQEVVEIPFEQMDFSYMVGDETDTKPCNVVMQIANRKELLGSLIGKGGCNIQSIHKHSGANIQMDKEIRNSSAETIDISLTGTVAQATMAVCMIAHKINFTIQSKDEDYDLKSAAISLVVPNNMVRHIIGKGGSVVNQIQTSSGAHIQIQNEHDMKPGALGRVVKIGVNNKPFNMRTLMHAKYLITRKMIDDTHHDPKWATKQKYGQMPNASQSFGMSGMPAMGMGMPPSQLSSQNMGLDAASQMALYNTMGMQQFDPNAMQQMMQQNQQQLSQMGQMPGMSGMPQMPQSVMGGMQQPGGMGSMPGMTGMAGMGGVGMLPQMGGQMGGAPNMQGGYSQAGGMGNSVVEMSVPDSMVSKLIGKGGSNVAEISKSTGCRVQFQKAEQMIPGRQGPCSC